jgi:diguanylate cyclase (GGDEF)-like protein
MHATLERRAPTRPHFDEPHLAEGPPHHIVYPIIGAFAALFIPIGAFIMRFIHADPILVRIWISSELTYNMDFYLYMAGVAMLTFVACGYILGNRSENQRVHNFDLRQRMEDLHIKSVTDGLTGAYSHAYLQETLAIEMERSHRHEHPLSVLMLDIDDFKKINDTHGHLFGDQVLKEATETISMNIRHEDVLGRYGGEEFLVIMPGADEPTAERVAQRVRRAVARAAIIDNAEAASRPAVHVTLSIGISTLNEGKAHTPKALLLRADQNLYRAKESGKNRVYSSASREVPA